MPPQRLGGLERTALWTLEGSWGRSSTRMIFWEEDFFLAGEKAGRFWASKSPSICARSIMLVVERSRTLSYVPLKCSQAAESSSKQT